MLCYVSFGKDFNFVTSTLPQHQQWYSHSGAETGKVSLYHGMTLPQVGKAVACSLPTPWPSTSYAGASKHLDLTCWSHPPDPLLLPDVGQGSRLPPWPVHGTVLALISAYETKPEPGFTFLRTHSVCNSSLLSDQEPVLNPTLRKLWNF